jgi:hypothetical protein
MLSDLTQAFVPVGETPPLTGREAESPVALWRDSPLVAAVTKSQSSHEIIIADYQSGRVIARVAQPDPPMRMVCSPSGQQLFVSGEQSCRLEGRLEWLEARRRNLDRWPPKPFREPVFWAAFTLSGAFDGETGGDA